MTTFVYAFLFLIPFMIHAQDGMNSVLSQEETKELTETVAVVTEGLKDVVAGPLLEECPLVPVPSDVPKLAVKTTEGSSCYEMTPRKGSGTLSALPYTELGNNQHRLMKRDLVARPYHTGDYLLRRLEGNNYQAILNLDFQSTTPGLAEAMLNRVRGCIQEINPYFKGEGDKKLELVILSKQDSLPDEFPMPEPIKINVTPRPAGYRGNASEFGSNFQCKTIGHELLHHLGLCDEYHESPQDAGTSAPATTNIADLWSCRQTTVSSSYMRNITESFNDVVPQNITCPCDDACKLAMKLGDPHKTFSLSQPLGSMISQNDLKEYCPGITTAAATMMTEGFDQPSNPNKFLGKEGSSYSFEERAMATTVGEKIYYKARRFTCDCSKDSSGECEKRLQTIIDRVSAPREYAGCASEPSLTPKLGANGETRVEGDSIIISTRGNGGSLLTAGQFDKILSGTCVGGSPQYEKCAAFSNIGKFITDPEDPTKTIPNPACNVPEECKDDDYYLHNRPARNLTPSVAPTQDQ